MTETFYDGRRIRLLAIIDEGASRYRAAASSEVLNAQLFESIAELRA